VKTYSGVIKMSQTDISTVAKYYDYVNFTVDCIIDEYQKYPKTDMSELVFESTDNADIIIYSSHNMDILQNSRKQPQEWKHMISDSDNWQKVIQIMAFDIFRQDLWDEIYNRDIDF